MSEDLLVDGYDYNPHTCMVEVPYNDYCDMKDKCKENKQLKSRLQLKENIIEGLDNTIENLEKVVEHKDNIIKEVREYIENNMEKQYGFNYEYNLNENEIKELLEILDKENKE